MRVCNCVFMCTGASRVLQALAKDKLFGKNPVRRYSRFMCCTFECRGHPTYIYQNSWQEERANFSCNFLLAVCPGKGMF